MLWENFRACLCAALLPFKTRKMPSLQTHFACKKTHYALEAKLELKGVE